MAAFIEENIHVSNSDVLEFTKVNGNLKCVQWLKEKNNHVENKPVEMAYHRSLEKLFNEKKILQKSISRANGKQNFENFLSNSFLMPKAKLCLRVSKISSTKSVTIHDDLKQKSLLLNKAELEVSNLNEKLNESIDKLDSSENKLSKCKLNLKRTKAREQYSSSKVKILESQMVPRETEISCCQEKDNIIFELKKSLKEKDKTICELKINCDYLEGVVQDIDKAQRTLTVFDVKSRKYTTILKQCIYELLQHNVSAAKVNPVIKSVLSLVNVQPNALPAKSTILDMNLQRLCLSQKHLAEVFSAEKNTTLLTDETSKFGNKFMGFEASDSKGNLWVLGLRDIETKSAEDTLKVLKEILQDLNEISDSVDNSVSKDILKHISATLSDRAATEVKFNNLLESYRAEILPLVYANFDQFSDQEKRSVENLCNFFCGLHSLVNFAVAAQSSITEVEKGIFNGPGPIFDKSFLKECEPGTCRLVRTASKAFASGSGADEKSGCQGPFREYIKDFLKEKKLHALPLKPYRGSRFNILFENASSIYFLNRQLKLFLESYGASNRLLKSILHDLKTPEFIAGVKALGLICTFITCPLWHILEDKSVSIIDMNTKYLQLTNFFIDASENTEDFMKGKLLPFGDDTYIVEDHNYTCLMEPSEYDGVVQTYLQVLFLSLGKLSNKLFKDHLPGGKLVGMDPTVVAKFKCTPKTSCFAESVFSQLDHLLKSKPNLSTLAAEAYITFSNNKTLNWLLNKPELERNILIEEATKNVKTVEKI
ncbi:unnamed protein product [Mytilus edulis]|uniref:Uncharacterized protein n=1 Tax=Mytilus edulis TaxID=6550 RepID=A0A8S3QDJ3_MYTED|nr:unnamed protein product [Mytilus edulis]